MEKQTHLLFLVLLFSFSAIISTGVLAKNGYGRRAHHHHHGHRHRHRHGAVKLFVFGDSYADTGNSAKSSSAWNEPYGITFPGKPGGRYSDGRVLTDYVASFFGIRSPVPLRWRKFVKIDLLRSGINFAYGGSGVFNTLMTVPNMTTQIDYFQQLLEEKLYTKDDLDSSVALVSLAGNDYITYIFTNGSRKEMSDFSKATIKQLAMNLKRIHSLGVRKVAVIGLEPVGCLPVNSNQTCSKTWNRVSKFHNRNLKRAAKKLNNEISDHHKPVFRILDLYKSFMSAFKRKHQNGSLKFKNPLEPCCVGLNGYFCGNVDEKGVKQYTVCKDPESFFYWDSLHPSQSGWHVVYLALKSSLHRLR